MKHVRTFFPFILLALASVGCAKGEACETALSTWQRTDSNAFRSVPDSDYAAAAETLRALESKLNRAAAIDTVDGALSRLVDDVRRVAKLADDFELAITTNDEESLEFYAHAYTNAIRGLDSNVKELARQCD